MTLSPEATQVMIRGEAIRSAQFKVEVLRDDPHIVMELQPLIRGVIQDPEGKPIPHADISVDCRSDNGRFLYSTLPLRTDAFGNFEVRWKGHKDPQPNMSVRVRRGQSPDPRYDSVLARGFTVGEEEVVFRFRLKE